MGSLVRNGRAGVSRQVTRLIPVGSFSGLAMLSLVGSDPSYVLAGLFGTGAVYTGARLLDRRSNRRKELRRRARENVRELIRVSRQDRTAAPQMKRICVLQDGLLESWELLPEEYRPLLDEDVHAIFGEIEDAARLARRRAALRRHLESVDRRAVSHRIRDLEKDLEGLDPDSSLRAPFESALAGRREELSGYGEILDGVSMINAQLEGVESLLANLRGELLAMHSSVLHGPADPNLARLKEKVSYFREGLDEVTRHVETLPATERMPAR